MPTLQRGGKFYVPGGDPSGYDSLNQAFGALPEDRQAAAQAFQFGAIGFGQYSNIRASGQDQSILGGMLSGAMAGSAGGWLGAIGGAIAGAIGTFFGNQSVYDDYKYGIPFIDAAGTAHFTNTENIQPAERAKMLAQIQDQFDSFWNDYVSLALKVGSSFPEFGTPGRGGGSYWQPSGAYENALIDGRFQSRASKMFMKHFDEWVNGTLPDEIAALFHEGLGESFQALGLTADRWNEIWQRFDTLDPKKAIALLNQLADAMIGMNEAADFFAVEGMRPGGGRGNVSFEMALKEAERLHGLSFAETLSESNDDIIKLANSIEHLVGEGQIRAANDLYGLMQRRMDAEKEHARQMIMVAEQTNRQYDAMIRDLELASFVDAEGNPNLEGQAQYLQDYADSVLKNMHGAKSLEELQYWNQEYMRTIGQINSIGAQMGPEMAAAYREWAIENLETGRSLFHEQMQKMAKEISDANAALWEQVQDAWKKFIGLLDSVDEGRPDRPGDGGGGDRDDVPVRPGPGDHFPNATVVNQQFATLNEATQSLNEQFSRLAGTLSGQASESHMNRIVALLEEIRTNGANQQYVDRLEEVIVRIEDPGGYAGRVIRRRIAG